MNDCIASNSRFNSFGDYITTILKLVGEHTEAAHRSGHVSVPALGDLCKTYALHLPFLPFPALDSDHRFFANRSRAVSLQAKLVLSEITLLTRSDSGNLAT